MGGVGGDCDDGGGGPGGVGVGYTVNDKLLDPDVAAVTPLITNERLPKPPCVEVTL